MESSDPEQGGVMSEFEEFEPQATQPEEFSRRRLRRGVYLLPVLFTLGNLLCGYYAIMVTLKGGFESFDAAAIAIAVAALLDTIDGRIARATGTATEFGKQFDSLADVISFGIAPAFLAFAWGARGVLASDIPQARHIYQLGWLVSSAFLICSAWRLARFNVQGLAPGHGSRYFAGLPTTPAACMIAATVHALKSPLEDWRFILVWFGVVAGLAALMASTVRYYSFKEVNWRGRQPSLVVVLVGLVALAMWSYSEIMLLVVVGGYVLSGISLHLGRVVRHRLVSRPA
jgi:CDP-diacylglycerol--serine O-phosphatidyltransferase